MNRENLTKLADALAVGDINGVEMFDMGRFCDKAHQMSLTCGTIGCAIGVAASIVLPKKRGESWWSYGQRMSGLEMNEEAFQWCFDFNWASVDNTPQGAAARIRYILEHGVPPSNWLVQMNGYAPLSYTT